MDNYLFDKDFLLTLDNYPTREVYARIISLTQEEEPREMIEGKTTGGSINIDGASAIRRTCSVSLVAEEVQLTDYYWTLNTKFKLEIGLRNFMRLYPDTQHPEWSNYPDICWFNQGIYLISSFSANVNTNTFSINIQGKDKMSQLNGDCGGVLTSSVDFGKVEYYDKNNDSTIYDYIPIKDIIFNAVHLYGNELDHKIIINDLDITGKQLMEYRGEEPLYLIINPETTEVIQATIDGDLDCNILSIDKRSIVKSIKIREVPVFSLGEDYVNTNAQTNRNPTLVNFGENKDSSGLYYGYHIQKVSFGQAAGYEEVPLTYCSKDSKTDLIGNVGETITSILDKIKQMLGDFEYFYDLNGNFIFQQQKNYINRSWSDVINTGDGVYINDIAYGSPTIYDFYNSKLFTAIANNPQISNIKNDYSVWGEKKGISDNKIPIHLRYAIDKKPEQYTTITVTDNDIQTFLANKYNIEVNANDEGEYVVTLDNDFIIHMKPQSGGVTYKIIDSSIQMKQRSMQYLDEDTPQMINMIFHHEYNNNGQKINYDDEWNTFEQNRKILAQQNGWDESVASQYVLLFKLLDNLYLEYGDGESSDAQVKQALEKLLIPSKSTMLTSVELNSIKEKYNMIYDGKSFIDFGYNTIDGLEKYVDWREIIYQMAKDYYQFNELENFLQKIVQANGALYPKGITGYERYYIDINGFWRQQYWGWDEELKPTIENIQIQNVRQANRFLIDNEDIIVESRMVPVFAEDLIPSDFDAQQEENKKINTLLKTDYFRLMLEKASIAIDNNQDVFDSNKEFENLAKKRLEKVEKIGGDMRAAEQIHNLFILLDVPEYRNEKWIREDILNFLISLGYGKEMLPSVISDPNYWKDFSIIYKDYFDGKPFNYDYFAGINQQIIDLSTLEKKVLYLPEGLEQTDYYIYDHQPDLGYSSFIPWWQYEDEVRINFVDAINELGIIQSSEEDSESSKYYYPGEEALNIEGPTIRELELAMIKWIDDGGHCNDNTFYILAHLRRNRIQACGFSLFATRQYEDLFVLWDQYHSEWAENALKPDHVFDELQLRELKSEYRSVFNEEYFNFPITLPDVITLSDGKTTRPQYYKGILYQAIAHLESIEERSLSSSDKNWSTGIIDELQTQMFQYTSSVEQESGKEIGNIFEDLFIRYSNLITLWYLTKLVNCTDEQYKVGRKARNLLLYGSFDFQEEIDKENNEISKTAFINYYEETFDITYDDFMPYYQTSSEYFVIDSNLDYSDAMLKMATELVARGEPLFENVEFLRLCHTRKAKVLQNKYNYSAAEQLENVYHMIDFYSSTNNKQKILTYLKLPASEKGVSQPDISTWTDDYFDENGVLFKSTLFAPDVWDDEEGIADIDYSKRMRDYALVRGHSKNDPEWIILARNRMNKVLILNYNYQAAVQFQNLCEMYMYYNRPETPSTYVWPDHIARPHHLDIIKGIITGQYTSDEDIIKARSVWYPGGGN